MRVAVGWHRHIQVKVLVANVSVADDGGKGGGKGVGGGGWAMFRQMTGRLFDHLV